MEQVIMGFRELMYLIFSNPLLLCVLALFPLLYFIYTKPRNSSPSPPLPPSPAKLPIIGNLHQLRGLIHRRLRDLAQKHGPVMFVQFGRTRVLVISSSDVVQEITRNHDIPFSDRYATTALRPFTKSGLFSRYGDHWKLVKKVSVLHLLSQKVVNEFQTQREEEISTMLETVRVSSSTGSEINLRDIFVFMVNSVVYRSFTGRKYGEVLNGMNFEEWTVKFRKLTGAFCFADAFPRFAWMDKLTGFDGYLKSTHRELDGFMESLVNECKKDTRGEKSLASILLSLQEEENLGQELTLTDIKAIMQSLFAAARDTIVTLMEWTMAELVKNPSTMRKAQDEVLRVVGMKSKISSSDIEQMHYLKCVIREATRLHPFAVVPRQTTKPMNISGYEIPANTRVTVNVWAIHRDPKVWENPEEFIPERFMNMKIDLTGRQRGFLPFGFGRRYCPGVYFALALAENVIANLLYSYDWEVPGRSKPEELDMSEKFQIAVIREHPLRLVPVPRVPNNVEA